MLKIMLQNVDTMLSTVYSFCKAFSKNYYKLLLIFISKYKFNKQIVVMNNLFVNFMHKK